MDGSGFEPRALMPKSGTHAFLLKLSTKPTAAVYSANLSRGKATAKSAAKEQLSAVEASQDAVVEKLPAGTKVLYRSHAASNAVAVRTDAKNVAALQRIRGVKAVYPIAAKKPSNGYATPLVGAPQAWTAYGEHGEDTTIAIIDTGLDWTHANFGGVGTTAAYDTARANETAAPPAEYVGPTAPKIIGGFDFAGDDYNADPTDPAYQPVPNEDPNPLDCNGHGSHVGGTAAGFGENADGSTYAGPYDNTTPFATMKIGPGMAPKAKLYGYRVFGCEGSSDVVGAAMARSADPNNDGDPSDAVDVINMSLGSDFGSSLDGDAQQANDLAAMGINVVVASGNGGDLYEVGGSPGNAPRTITVANSVDASSVIDALNVTAPPSVAGDDYGAQRSVLYDWATKPDLAGTLAAAPLEASNREACAALSPGDAAKVNGKIAFIEWNDVTPLACGSIARAANVAAAGAIGFIFANSTETFSAGINGSATIPGVMVTKSAGDTLRDHLAENIVIGGTIRNGYNQMIPADDDKLNDSSSRNNRGAGNVKPDVAGVGTSVFSTEVGTGDGGFSISGTSMATPQVAGLTALVVGKHPTWTTEEVKADIMNTAGQDLFTGGNHTGDKYAPNRVGAGRIQAKAALDNEVLAYSADHAGAVSVSFGPLEVTAPVTQKKTIKVVNKGAASSTYAVSYEAITTIPGVNYTVSPASVTVGAGETKTVEVTLSIPNPASLTKRLDPTMSAEQGGDARDFLADASGRVVLNSADKPDLRVPVYSAPRPASQMTQAAELGLTPGANQTGALALTGTGVNQGAGTESVKSKVAAFELSANSGLVPECLADADKYCVHHADERSADIKHVGVTQHTSNLCGECVDFAITTHGPMHTIASQQEFDIFIDADNDGTPETVSVNTRFPDTDVFISATFDLATEDVIDIEYINDRLGDEDTAVFGTDTIVIPVNVDNLGLGGRFSYSVEAYSGYGIVDVLGAKMDGDVDGSLSWDPTKPGITVGAADKLLFDDQPGQSLTINRNRPEYNKDGGDGLLVVHFHNKAGNKAQVVALKGKSNVAATFVPTSSAAGAPVQATVTVAKTDDTTPTGKVTIKTSAGVALGSGVLDATGKAVITVQPKPAGTLTVFADYAGDAAYAAGVSANSTLTIVKNKATVKLKVAKVIKRGSKVTATVKVATVNGLVPTGKVTLKQGSKKLGKATLSAAGKAKITFTIAKKGSAKLVAKYAGDGSYNAGKATSTVKVV